MGVPRADGFFGNCNSNNPKNFRTRCSALIKCKKQNILIISTGFVGWLIGYKLHLVIGLIEHLVERDPM